MAHRWRLTAYTSPSGKMMYHCPVCKIYDPAPVKDKYETRICKEDEYAGTFIVSGGMVKIRTGKEG